MSLADQKCIPANGETPPMAAEQAEKLLQELSDGWHLAADGLKLLKTYSFKDFNAAFGFVSALSGIIEEERHYPEMHLSWGRVLLEVSTHDINGLTEADFIFAAKADRTLAELK